MDYEPVFWDIETTGLNPMAQRWWDNAMAAQVTAVGIGVIENWEDDPSAEEAEYDVSVACGDDEYKLLQKLGREMRDMEFELEPFLVGYNSRQYDHPYIGARFSRKRLDGEPFTSDWKRLDMQRVAGKDHKIDKRYPKEDEYAVALGVEIEDEYDGSDMPQMFKDGNWDAIRSHATKDVEKSILMFLKRQELMMDTFYDHYGIEADGSSVPEIELPTDE